MARRKASGPAFGGVLSLGVAQPLKVEWGTAHLTYGNGYDLASQSLTYGQADASLAGQRRLELTAGLAKDGPRSRFRFGLARDVAQDATRALAGWSTHY